ncbi:lipid-binding protein [Mangrovimonas aestuarii]|uniref:lipid-binding protein n=1 Tax=Mangrovimonas aestuarii TaxID=3018443 RepID=UPI0023797C91|nr:lipid-binding protein [Mangrovimonas aestuarii]
MKRIYFIQLLSLLVFAFSFTSCDEGGEPDPGGTKVEKMAGDWYVEFLVDGEDIYNLGYALISTYNTASDDGTEMWIDDHQNTWWFKVKCPVNVDNMTFSGSGLESNVDDYEVVVDITNGEIIKDGATTSGGNTSDYIRFEAVFSDDPTTTYELVGYKRTGFLEDEH